MPPSILLRKLPASLIHRCEAQTYMQNAECQKAHWQNHKPDCIPDVVKGIVIPCDGDLRAEGRSIFESVDVPRSHPIHREGETAPLPKRVGIPLIVYKQPRPPRERYQRERLDNQKTTYLMIDPVTGFAPAQWQQDIGTVTVIRADHKPLTLPEIETIWMYQDWILDLFGDGPERAHAQMTKEKFRAFFANWKVEPSGNQAGLAGMYLMSVREMIRLSIADPGTAFVRCDWQQRSSGSTYVGLLAGPSKSISSCSARTPSPYASWKVLRARYIIGILGMKTDPDDKASSSTRSNSLRGKTGADSLSQDLWGHVALYLDPVDIVSIRETCSSLHAVSRQRFIWLEMARRTCEENGLFKASFPLEKMSDAELEHLALSPTKFEKLVTGRNGLRLIPAHVSVFKLQHEDDVIDTDTIFMIPGGRYLITRRPEVGIYLWDLGYNARPASSCSIRHLPIGKPFVLHAPVPTPDGKGVRFFYCHERCTDLEIVDIYTTSDKPDFQIVGSLKFDEEYRSPRLKAQTSTHLALAIPGIDYVMIVKCPDRPNGHLEWYWIEGLNLDYDQQLLCGLALFGETLIAFHPGKMSVVHLPDLGSVTHGEMVSVRLNELPSFNLPRTERPYNIYTPEWFGPVEDGRHLLGVYVTERDDHRNRWEIFTFSDIQIFSIQPQPRDKPPSILPIRLGEPVPVAGPRQARTPLTSIFETCTRDNRFLRTPSSFYLMGMTAESSAPLVLAKYHLPKDSQAETPSDCDEDECFSS
ncbi:hypothetical protein NMY22_g10109 [Coprinellus aureogranulatus]|nr:hypothetical protein NMY22_g10109 [Coprinellus aureogranulatus]